MDVWVGSEDKLLDPRWPHELARRVPQGTPYLRSAGTSWLISTTAKPSMRCEKTDLANGEAVGADMRFDGVHGGKSE